MACCLTAPSHYLNQCRPVINEVQWHSPEGNLSNSIQNINHINVLRTTRNYDDDNLLKSGKIDDWGSSFIMPPWRRQTSSGQFHSKPKLLTIQVLISSTLLHAITISSTSRHTVIFWIFYFFDFIHPVNTELLQNNNLHRKKALYTYGQLHRGNTNTDRQFSRYNTHRSASEAI